MNHCIPDWNFDVPVTNQKKPIGPDNELVELLWRNGQVVLHSQTLNRRPSPNLNENRQVQNHDQPGLRGTGVFGNLSNLTQDEETASWLQYPIEDSFEKEFCSNYFTDLPQSDPILSDKQTKQLDENKLAGHVLSSHQSTNPMPPPRFQISESGKRIPSLGSDESLVNFSKFPTLVKGDLGSSNGQGRKGSGNLTEGDVRECSAMTVGSSHCASNQVLNDLDFGRVSSSGVGTAGFSVGPFNHDLKKVIMQNERGQTDTLEQTVSSSSGGSGSSFGRTFKQSTGVSGHKRKGRDIEESESLSEAAELESGIKPTKRSGSSRRSRAAEVHNLSERRRRDRINEKMKALQELIPHSNKTDKASMLDEAIEYLKSLQLQLQMMWMGGGMAPMMFPGAQHCLSRMGMGMNSPPMPSMQNPMHFQRVPLMDQSMSVSPTQNPPLMCQNPFLNPLNYQHQMQNPSFPEQYAQFMSFNPMQTASQPMNMFRFGTQMVQQNQPTTGAGSSIGPALSTESLQKDNQYQLLKLVNRDSK